MVDWSMAIQLHTETWIALCLFSDIFGFCLGLAMDSCLALATTPFRARCKIFTSSEAHRVGRTFHFMLDPRAYKYSDFFLAWIYFCRMNQIRDVLYSPVRQMHPYFQSPPQEIRKSFVPMRKALAILFVHYHAQYFLAELACLGTC